MRKLKYLLITLYIFLLSCGGQGEDKVSTLSTIRYRQLSSKFMGELKSTLMREMKEGGVIKAVSVCSDTAQIKTAEFSSRENIVIKRVSLQNRNKLNTPDEFEREVLHYFASLKTEGEMTDSSEFIEKITEDGKTKVRYMKPILIQAPCLTCHGDDTQVLPEVAEYIKGIYPDDKARNYKVGDLRGAVSITEVIN